MAHVPDSYGTVHINPTELRRKLNAIEAIATDLARRLKSVRAEAAHGVGNDERLWGGRLLRKRGEDSLDATWDLFDQARQMCDDLAGGGRKASDEHEAADRKSGKDIGGSVKD